MSRPRVAIVTGGGRGIGAAIAEVLGRQGAHVVTVDPLVTLDGQADPDRPVEPTTADRIVAAGGSAVASPASVTDRAQIDQLVAGLAADHGGVDAVVNVAGITRPTSFTTGTEEDWRAVLEVHLDGYRNVLRAALEHPGSGGTCRVLGVTSGAGWRPGDAGAYSCAKRAVAALTWQVGAVAPDGVTVNALSPIALTRMVTAAMAARPRRTAPDPSGGGPTSGGLRLGAGMPAPEEIAPLAAHLLGTDAGWIRGRVLFGAGSEVALVDPPRLLEAVGVGDPERRAATLDQVVAGAFVAAHARQDTTGGANPRFPTPGTIEPVTAPGARVAVVGGPPAAAAALTDALGRRRVGTITHVVPPDGAGFASATALVAELDAADGPLDAVVVFAAGGDTSDTGGTDDDWRAVLAAHEGLTDRILSDAAWARAAAELSVGRERPLRLVTVVPAADTGGRSRAQAAAQLARAAAPATGDRVVATVVEARTATAHGVLGELVTHLAVHPDAAALQGAHLVAGDDWVGLCGHPRAASSIVLGGTGIPGWFDDALRDVVGER